MGVPPAAAWCQLRCLAAARAPGGARAAGPVGGPPGRTATEIRHHSIIHYDNTRGRPRREPPEGDYTGADRTPSGRASRGPDRARPPGRRSQHRRYPRTRRGDTRDRFIRLYTTPRTYAVCIQLSQWQAVPSTTVLYYIYTDSDTAARTAHTTTPCRVPSHTRLKL